MHRGRLFIIVAGRLGQAPRDVGPQLDACPAIACVTSAVLGDGLGPFPASALDVTSVELCDVARGECLEADAARLATQTSVRAAARDRTPWSLGISAMEDGDQVILGASMQYEHALTRALVGSRPAVGDEMTLTVRGATGAAVEVQRYRFTFVNLPAEGAGCEVPCSFSVSAQE